MIKINIDKCVGCHTCELVCAYHHAQCYNPQYSSIRINFKDNYGIDITVLDTCDCVDHKKPLCITLCPTDAVTLK